MPSVKRATANKDKDEFMIISNTKYGSFPRLDIGKNIRVVSLFTGCGGLDIGFDLAGFDVVYATDIDADSCSTLRQNVGGILSPHTQIAQEDIRKLDLNSMPTNIDLVIGGPPCQSFSASGRRAGGAPGRLDARGTLFEAYCKVIAHLQPQAFLFENVRGILGTNKGEDWAIIVESFRKLGFSISYRILDSLDYGAPQQRERMIMVGHKLKTEFLFPRPLYGPDSKGKIPYITASQALTSIDSDPEDKENLVLRDGKYAHLLPLVPPGENYLFFTAKRGYPEPIFAYRSRFSDFLYKANPDAPIKTLIASPGKYTGPFHWENRSFTIQEYMRLQGFPDGYAIFGKRSDCIRQIGNSVSPKLSYQLARAIASQVFKRNDAIELLPLNSRLSFDKRKSEKAKKTREKHENVLLASTKTKNRMFTLEEYTESLKQENTRNANITINVQVHGLENKIIVRDGKSLSEYAKLNLSIFKNEKEAHGENISPLVTLEVLGIGKDDYMIQSMWNAVDAWVRRVSSFHSLFELYGHFTEPHPIFKIDSFELFSKSPIGLFAQHISKFEHCSTYFPRKQLEEIFSKLKSPMPFVEIVKFLRKYRFDIRCFETNIAMPRDVYMVSYPFTLPYGKQMNFSVKDRSLS